MNKKKMKQVVFETIGVLISFLVLIPFLMVFLNSMKSKRQANLLQLRPGFPGNSSWRITVP